MRKLILGLFPVIDILMLPFVYVAAAVLKLVRRGGIQRLPACRTALRRVGVFPIRDHYYEPQFHSFATREPLDRERSLPGIAFVNREQAEFLTYLTYADELRDTPVDQVSDTRFHMNNPAFRAGDAEYWYQIIRALKPKRLFEIGSGHSTLMALNAIAKNRAEDHDYSCRHICIEPFERPWLEKTGVTVIRDKVEDVDISFFSELEENDILFIDSSHVIRPQGDVVYEYLEILPTLSSGVVVHIHDVFTPRNYLKLWVEEEVRLWNEQYLLEAFLTENPNWKILGALNYLRHHHYDELKAVAPFLTSESEPASFYIQKH